jgi:hypothetical protein
LDYYNIPANFTDAGKLLGLFEIRNTIEAVIVALPLLYYGFLWAPFALTGKIVTALTLAVSVGGFALLGVYDDCLSRFVKNVVKWLRKRKNLLYRGEAHGT